jgi:hypothetical protein
MKQRDISGKAVKRGVQFELPMSGIQSLSHKQLQHTIRS